MISVGIVGAGAITRNSHLPVLINTPGVEVAWLYDRNPRAAAGLGGAYGVRAPAAAAPRDLPPCDVALLAIPVLARGPYLEEFAERDVAVLCEKPFAASGSEHARLLDMFAPYALGAGYMRRFYRWAILMRRLVAERLFGALRSIRIHEGNRSKGSGAEGSFLDDPSLGAMSGVLMDLGSHTVDLALHITGAKTFEVLSCSRISDGPVDRKVTALVSLKGSGVHAEPIELSYGVSWLDRQENRVCLGFEHASVWSSLAPDAVVYAGDPEHPREAIELVSTASGAVTYSQAFFLEWQHFLDGVRLRLESSISASSALLTSQLVEALLRAPER